MTPAPLWQQFAAGLFFLLLVVSPVASIPAVRP